MRATRDNLGFLLAKALQRWNELLAAGFRRGGFAEVRPAYGSVLLPLFEEDGLRLSELDRKSTRLKLQSHSDLVCRLLLEKKKNKEKNKHNIQRIRNNTK